MFEKLIQKIKELLGYIRKEKPRVYVRFKPIYRRIGYRKANGRRVRLINNSYARNPTYQELIDFLNEDKTEKIQYIPHKFVCADFAQLLHNRAERCGIRAAWVFVDFTNGVCHACNAFKTIDRGLIFVDCTNSNEFKPGVGYDATVKVWPHKEYRPREINDGWYYNAMGIVKRYKIYW